jgi:putative hydrolase of the HAD superfamily
MSRALDAYTAVWFDAADTLLESPDAEQTIQHFLAEHGYALDAESITAIVRHVMNDRYHFKTTHVNQPCTPESDRAFWVDVYSEIFSGLGLTDAKLFGSLSQKLYDQFTGPTMYRLFPDVIPTMEKLRTMGKQIGIISNFAPTLAHIFDTWMLDSRSFEPFVVSTLVGLEKPDTTILAYALEQSGLAATEVLFVGDHLTNDVVAPNAVGIDAVRLKRSDRQHGEGMATLDLLFEEEIPFLSKGR